MDIDYRHPMCDINIIRFVYNILCVKRVILREAPVEETYSYYYYYCFCQIS